MRVTSLGSGSSGNALLVEAGPQRRTKLLIDAGLNARVITERLLKAGSTPGQLAGIVVTHEHFDHVVGLPLLVKRYAVPVITDPRTYAAIEEGLASGAWRSDSGHIVSGALELEPDTQLEARNSVLPYLPLPAGTSCVVGDIGVTSFPVSHDAVAPCGYLLQAGGCRVCVTIDSGEVTPVMLGMMQQADLLVIESNHDRERLLRGPYPQHLKQRILGATGHLSNDQAAHAILQTWRTDHVRWLWLSHLSRTNNTPALALKSVRAHLNEAHAKLSQVHISTLPPTMGPTWDSTQLWHTPSLWETQI